MGRPDRFIKISRAELNRYAKTLAKRISRAHGKPSTIVYIERGGMIPARILGEELSIRNVVGVKAVHYDDVGVMRSTVRVGRIWRHFNSDGYILIVDDITDSGKTMKAVRGMINGIASNEIVTCTLLHKPRSAFVPDFYYRKIPNGTWAIFPHEIAETRESFEKDGNKDGLKLLKGGR